MTIPKVPFPELVAQRVKELRGYALRVEHVVASLYRRIRERMP